MSKDRPSHWANSSGTAFKNPWPSADNPSWAEVLQLSFPFSLYPAALQDHSHAREVKVVQPDWGVASFLSQNISTSTSDCIVGTWLGHAAAFVEFFPTSDRGPEIKEKSKYLLFDPIFSSRAGPTAYTGPTRFKRSPCRVSDLPGCDAVFISHNHYDHLDLATVTTLNKQFPNARWYVPLGNKKWCVASGIQQDLVDEMDWWDTKQMIVADGKSQISLRVSCVPAQHNSGRAGLDGGSTLWCGWVVEKFVKSKSEDKESRKGAVYHAGDTGYRRTTRSDTVCPVFKEIGNRFGGFDLSFLPIWRGGSLGFISYWGLRLSHHDMPSALHCSPKDAVAIHKDVKSRNTVGVHFGTFIGSENESHDALVEFRDACDEAGVKDIVQRHEADGTTRCRCT